MVHVKVNSVKYIGINLIDHIIYARIRLFNGLGIVLCMKRENILTKLV